MVLPDVEMPAAKKGGKRDNRAEEKKVPASTTRSHRAAKHVSSGLDATSELYYQQPKQPEERKAKQPAKAAGRRGKAEEDEQSEAGKAGDEMQQSTAVEPRTHSADDSKQPPAAEAAADLEEQAAAEASKKEAAESRATNAAVPLQPLRGLVLLISAKPAIYRDHEALAKTLGAQVSHHTGQTAGTVQCPGSCAHTHIHSLTVSLTPDYGAVL